MSHASPTPRRKEKRSQSKKRLWIVLSTVLVLLLALGGAAAVVWSQYGERISLQLGWTTNDYEGAGHGEAVVVIHEGEIGADVADSLAAAGVVKTAQAFYDLLLVQDPAVEFQPGSYQLKLEMSAQAALDALQDPANKLELKVVVTEGMAAADALQSAADVLGIAYSDFETAMANYTDFGVPADFPSIEGFLFPATYTFQPEATADTVVQRMVDRMWQALDEHGVAEKDALEVLTLASVVQREAGSDLDDFPKIARVFLNRIDQDMLLQSDATVTYGTGNTHTVWTTEAERADASNKYNTYANPGLPIGPIGNPGDAAIDAVMHPAKGKWLYFATINLETGETAFAKSIAEHEENVDKLAAWCTQHRAEGGTRCD